MADDQNTFPLGPARVDPDRDLQDTVTQGVTQASGQGGEGGTTTVIGGAGELALATAIAIDDVNNTVLVSLTDGSSLGYVQNATGYSILPNQTVVVGRVSQGSYVVVGSINSAGEVAQQDALILAAYSTTAIGHCRLAVDLFNDLGLGADLVVTRDPFAVPSVLPTGSTNGVTPAATFTLVTGSGLGDWYAFFDGELYTAYGAPLGRSLARLDQGTGGWVVISNNIYGDPVVRLDGLYYIGNNNANNSVFRIPAGSLVPVVAGNAGMTFRGFSAGGYDCENIWMIAPASNRISRCALDTGAGGVAFVVVPFGTPSVSDVTGNAIPLWGAGPNNLMGVSIMPGESYYAYILKPNGRAFILPNIMLDTGAVSDKFNNDPLCVTIQSITPINDYSMYLCGAYSPDGGTTLVPCIWKFSYNESSGQYSVSQRWEINLGTGYLGFAYGLMRRGLGGQSAWMVGELNVGDNKAVFRASLG